MKIYITRHSQTQWNEEKRLQGWKDSSLTQKGIEDAKALCEYMKTIDIDKVYSSPIQRAFKTAETIFPQCNIITDDRLKEMNFGDYEGKVIHSLKNDKSYYNLWHYPRSNLRLKNGESYQEVVNRLSDFFQDIYRQKHDQTIFITIHGMLFTILHGIALNLPIERFHEVNQQIVRGCSLSLFEFDGQQFKIEYIGDDSFLSQTDEIIKYD